MGSKKKTSRRGPNKALLGAMAALPLLTACMEPGSTAAAPATDAARSSAYYSEVGALKQNGMGDFDRQVFALQAKYGIAADPAFKEPAAAAPSAKAAATVQVSQDIAMHYATFYKKFHADAGNLLDIQASPVAAPADPMILVFQYLDPNFVARGELTDTLWPTYFGDFKLIAWNDDKSFPNPGAGVHLRLQNSGWYVVMVVPYGSSTQGKVNISFANGLEGYFSPSGGDALAGWIFRNKPGSSFQAVGPHSIAGTSYTFVAMVDAIGGGGKYGSTFLHYGQAFETTPQPWNSVLPYTGMFVISPQQATSNYIFAIAGLQVTVPANGVNYTVHYEQKY